MKIFVSWSGERSRQTAELFQNWIQCVIQAAKPWISSKDIDRGSLWFSEITNELANTSIGIICLTNENINNPWILFESGALAKGLESNRVCTFLVDLETTDISDPLAQFNHTLPNKSSVFQLVRTINNLMIENSLSDDILLNVFETYWPKFEEKFKSIIETTQIKSKKVDKKRSETDIMGEILNSVRDINKRLRRVENNNQESFIPKIEKTPFEFLNLNPRITKILRISGISNSDEFLSLTPEEIARTINYSIKDLLAIQRVLHNLGIMSSKFTSAIEIITENNS